MPRSPTQAIVAPAKAPRWAIAALIGANIALSSGPFFVRLADVGPVAAGFWRLALGLPVLLVLAALIAKPSAPRFTPALVAIVALSGVLFAADLASWHLGIMRTKLANATLFGNATSLIYPVYGFLIARAWPTRGQAAALAMALVGSVMLMGQSFELSRDHLIGDLLCLLAGVFYTVYFVAIARARATLAPLPLLAASTAASVLPMLGFALLLGEKIAPVDWTPLIAIALLSQVVGQGLMVAALGRVSPLVIGLALLTQPIVAATIGWLAFDETLGALDIAGATLVGAALALVTVMRRPAAPA